LDCITGDAYARETLGVRALGIMELHNMACQSPPPSADGNRGELTQMYSPSGAQTWGIPLMSIILDLATVTHQERAANPRRN
jgi:hypothetical protein